MGASEPALVEPDVMRWARESVGLTALAVSRRLKLPDDRVAAWESGEMAPTIAQLKAAAAVYRRSLAVFFLAEPPTDFDTMRDFRRHEGAEAGEWSPELHGEYRRALEQRESALELAELDERPVSAAWRLLRDKNQTDQQLAATARERLFADAPLPIPTSSDKYAHLNAWVAATENAGVMVLATRGGRVKPKEARAFSLYFDDLPVIVVNGSDWPRPRLFSLAHELAHLLLQTAGLCDTVSDLRATNPDRRLEARCNAIAAMMLMPSEAVLARPQVRARPGISTDWDYDTLAAAAGVFGVSAEAFLRRLATLGRTTEQFYEQQREVFRAAYEAAETRSKTGKGDFYKTTVRDVGKGFVRAVADARRRRVIDDYTAASYLQVKVHQIPQLAVEAGYTVPI